MNCCKAWINFIKPLALPSFHAVNIYATPQEQWILTSVASLLMASSLRMKYDTALYLVAFFAGS
jgi:hypothetical protein